MSNKNTGLKKLLTSMSVEELLELITLAQEVLKQAPNKPEDTTSPGQRMVTFENIRIVKDKTGKYALAFTPFHPDFVKGANKLNGKWQRSNTAWVFDVKDIDRVRDLATEVYGTDGKNPVEVVDIEVTLTGNTAHVQSLFMLGRQIAHRYSRDDKVKLGDKVIVISGSFANSGGSRNNPSIMAYSESPVTILVRNVPLTVAQQAVSQDPNTYKIQENN